MLYFDGSVVSLGDVVTVPVPGGNAKARVVMLGDTYAHLEIDPRFVEWVKAERMLDSSSAVIEWLHRDPGGYVFSPIDQFVMRLA